MEILIFATECVRGWMICVRRGCPQMINAQRDVLLKYEYAGEAGQAEFYAWV